jgi:peptidoglycan/xylan/chitin deacetylase (PgdA/CDA1 family)
LIGKQIEAYPETAKAILADGHEAGGHSYGWETLAFKKKSYVESQLDKMAAAFVSIGVTNLTLFRPPNGLLSPGQNKILEARELQHISADILAGDWKVQDVEKIRETVLSKVRPGSIIVLHDGGGDRTATVAAVPEIIDGLRAKGYSFVAVSELLKK